MAWSFRRGRDGNDEPKGKIMSNWMDFLNVSKQFGGNPAPTQPQAPYTGPMARPVEAAPQKSIWENVMAGLGEAGGNGPVPSQGQAIQNFGQAYEAADIGKAAQRDANTFGGSGAMTVANAGHGDESIVGQRAERFGAGLKAYSDSRAANLADQRRQLLAQAFPEAEQPIAKNLDTKTLQEIVSNRFKEADQLKYAAPGTPAATNFGSTFNTTEVGPDGKPRLKIWQLATNGKPVDITPESGAVTETLRPVNLGDKMELLGTKTGEVQPLGPISIGPNTAATIANQQAMQLKQPTIAGQTVTEKNKAEKTFLAPTAIEKADEAIQLIDEMLTNPGLTNATSLKLGRAKTLIPGTPEHLLAAQETQLLSKEFLTGVSQLLKLGSMDHAEGMEIKNAATTLKRSLGTEQYTKALQKIRNAYERTKLKNQQLLQGQQQEPMAEPIRPKVMPGPRKTVSAGGLTFQVRQL